MLTTASDKTFPPAKDRSPAGGSEARYFAYPGPGYPHPPTPAAARGGSAEIA